MHHVKHRVLYENCKKYNCSVLHDFETAFGHIPESECIINDAFNEIVSSKDDDVKIYVIDNVLWIFEDERYLNKEISINTMLMTYVLFAHCNGLYKGISAVGYWEQISGGILLLHVEKISTVTLESISYNYIGYEKGSSWIDSCGTNKHVLYEAVDFFKHTKKYGAALAHFEYDVANCKLISSFSEGTKYAIIKDANHYLSVPINYDSNDETQISANYISDIHLGHHIDTSIPIMPQIRRIVRHLVESQQPGLVFFVGDIAIDRNLCVMFYKEYMNRRQFQCYKRWKSRHAYIPAISKQEAEKKYENSIMFLSKKIDSEVRHIKPWIKYTKKLEAKNSDELNKYINSSYFKSKHCPEFVSIRLRKIKKIEAVLHEFNKESYIENLQKEIGEKFYTKRKIGGVYAILGNHETADFDTFDEASCFYSRLFKEIGINFLNNSIMADKNFLICGGCGFAKYNVSFNISNANIPCARNFSREDEIDQTDIFESVYHKALNMAQKERKPLFVLTHYPTKDCLVDDICDSKAVYFFGHTHRNVIEYTERRHIYADNQIGYKNKVIKFKTVRLGTVSNPFADMDDGCYEITTEQYRDYYNYSGEPLSGTSMIGNLISQGGHLYMIKRSGFYGFFVQNKVGKFSICVGGKPKRLSDTVKSIDYLTSHFDAMLNIYLTAMLPFRRIQESISNEVQSLGLSGYIHGCIIDADFYNHIMLNPIDGTITYYYSPAFGLVQQYSSFEAMIKSMDLSYLNDGQKGDIQARYSLMCASNGTLMKSSFTTSPYIGEMIQIDIKNSIYSLSEKIGQLQRLFSSRVLRDWDDSLLVHAENIETSSSSLISENSSNPLV